MPAHDADKVRAVTWLLATSVSSHKFVHGMQVKEDGQLQLTEALVSAANHVQRAVQVRSDAESDLSVHAVAVLSRRGYADGLPMEGHQSDLT